ncbi:MAG: hypothetical protein H0T51_16145 [Pirellulales bacterium]|nr:hypothetical protein [Pirellulales bacterium]
MSTKLVAALIVLAASGCRMCSDSCDYSAPVAGSPYGSVHGRAGSAFSGEIYPTVPPTPQAPPASPAPATPLPEVVL